MGGGDPFGSRSIGSIERIIANAEHISKKYNVDLRKFGERDL